MLMCNESLRSQPILNLFFKTLYSRSTVENWKRGKYVPDAENVEILVHYCLKHGRLDQEWARSLLWQAQYPEPERLLRNLFRSEDGGLISKNEGPTPPLPEFDESVLQELETPGGAVKLRDELYIEREADLRLQRELIKPGTTTIIRAPRQTGKTSLLVRGLYYAHQNGARNADLNMQSVASEDLTSLDSFLRFLAEFIADELELDLEVEKLWHSSLPSTRKLTKLFRRYILTKDDNPIILAIDEADRLLHSGFSADFFGLIRSWHDTRSRDERWNRLNIVLVISTEPYLLIPDLSQSPFNVGYKIQLDDFDDDQVRDLNQRHNSPLKECDIPQFMTLLNGHPYLTRLALYTLVTEQLTWTELNDIAVTAQSPFSDHLRHHYRLLLNNRDLRVALEEVIKRERCNNEKAFFCLQQAGLVKGVGDKCACRCGLYRSYFSGIL